MPDRDRDPRSHRTYGYLAAALFAGAALTEIVMITTGRYWPRFGPAHNHVVMGLLAALWALAAVAVLIRRRSRRAAIAALTLSVVGVMALWGHALIGLARVYLPLAFLQIFFLWRALRGSEWQALRRTAERSS
ncbi:MAG: hypothetical protein M5U28_21935 [Sandaracinaceae bacterium]|nr:hypothetical protein [Sandaracinaceae bacterium]